MRCYRCVPLAAVLLWSLSAGSLGPGLAQEEESPLISGVDLLDGLKNPERWLMYSGDYTGQRHSPLQQINPENVRNLSPRWTFRRIRRRADAVSNLRPWCWTASCT